MDFSALIADLRTIASRYNGRDTDRNVSTAMYCEMFRKILQKAENGVTEYADQIVILWMTLSQLCNTYQTLAACPARDSLYQHIFLLCAKVVLNIKWQQLPDDDQGKVNFSQTIANTHQQLEKTGFTQFELLTHLMENPWTDPTLSKIMSGDDKEESSGSDTETEETEREKERKHKEKLDEIAKYIRKEDPLILKLRVEMLTLDNCEDFASNLCNCLVKYEQFKDDLDLREMQFVLLHKLNQMDKLQEEMLMLDTLKTLTELYHINNKFKCEQIICHFGIKIINRLEQKESNQQLCIRLVQIFLVQDWINPDRNCCTKELLKLWIRHQYMADRDRGKFLENVWSIAKLSSKTEQICLLISGLQKECGAKLRQLYTDLCVYAINIDKGGCEKEMMQGNMDGLKDRQKAMANTCEKLAGIVAMTNLKAAKISALTAFAFNPSRQNLYLVEKMYVSKSLNQAQHKRKEKPLKGKDRRETHDGEVNLATLYEVERLLNMLRPYYLNPDLSWQELFPVCQKFMAEKGTIELKDYQNQQNEKMSKPVKDGLMQYYCDDTSQFIPNPNKQSPKGPQTSPKSPWTTSPQPSQTKPQKKESTKLIPYAKLQNMSLQGSPIDMSKTAAVSQDKIVNMTKTNQDPGIKRPRGRPPIKTPQFDFAKLLEATKNMPQLQKQTFVSQPTVHLPYVPGLTTEEVEKAMIQQKKNFSRSISVDHLSSQKQLSTSQSIQSPNQQRSRTLSLERQLSSHSNTSVESNKSTHRPRIIPDRGQDKATALSSFQESFVKSVSQSKPIEIMNAAALSSSATGSKPVTMTPIPAPRSRQPSKEELQYIVDWLQKGTEDAKITTLKPKIVVKTSEQPISLAPKQTKPVSTANFTKPDNLVQYVAFGSSPNQALQNTQQQQELKIKSGAASKNFASQVMSKFGIKPGMSEEEINVAKIKAIMAQKQLEKQQKQEQLKRDQQKIAASKGFLLIPGSAQMVMQAKMQGQRTKALTNKSKAKTQENTLTPGISAMLKSSLQNVSSQVGSNLVSQSMQIPRTTDSRQGQTMQTTQLYTAVSKSGQTMQPTQFYTAMSKPGQAMQLTQSHTAVSRQGIGYGKQAIVDVNAQSVKASPLTLQESSESKSKTFKPYSDIDIQHALQSLSKVLDKSNSVLTQNQILQGKILKPSQDKDLSRHPVRPASAMPSFMSNSGNVITTANSVLLQSTQNVQPTTVNTFQNQKTLEQNSAYQLLYLGQIKTGSLDEGQQTISQVPPIQNLPNSSTIVVPNEQLIGFSTSANSLNVANQGNVQTFELPTVQNLNNQLQNVTGQPIQFQNVVAQNPVQAIGSMPVQQNSATPVDMNFSNTQSLSIQRLSAQTVEVNAMNSQNILMQGASAQPMVVQGNSAQNQTLVQNVSAPTLNVQGMPNMSLSLQTNQSVINYQSIDNSNSLLIGQSNKGPTNVDLQNISVGTSDLPLVGIDLNIKRLVPNTTVTFTTSTGLMASKISTPPNVLPLDNQNFTTFNNMVDPVTGMTLTQTNVAGSTNFSSTAVCNISNIVSSATNVDASTILGSSQIFNQMPAVPSLNIVPANYSTSTFISQQGNIAIPASSTVVQYTTNPSQQLPQLIPCIPANPGSVSSVNFAIPSENVSVVSNLTNQQASILPKTATTNNILVGPFQFVTNSSLMNSSTVLSASSMNSTGFLIPVTSTMNVSAVPSAYNQVTKPSSSVSLTQTLPVFSMGNDKPSKLEALLKKSLPSGGEMRQNVQSVSSDFQNKNGLEIVRRVSTSELESAVEIKQNVGSLDSQQDVRKLEENLITTTVDNNLKLLSDVSETFNNSVSSSGLETLLTNSVPPNAPGLNIVDVHITTVQENNEPHSQIAAREESNKEESKSVDQVIEQQTETGLKGQSLSNPIQNSFWKDFTSFKERMANVLIPKTTVQTESQQNDLSDKTNVTKDVHESSNELTISNNQVLPIQENDSHKQNSFPNESVVEQTMVQPIPNSTNVSQDKSNLNSDCSHEMTQDNISVDLSKESNTSCDLVGESLSSADSNFKSVEDVNDFENAHRSLLIESQGADTDLLETNNSNFKPDEDYSSQTIASVSDDCKPTSESKNINNDNVIENNSHIVETEISTEVSLSSETKADHNLLSNSSLNSEFIEMQASLANTEAENPEKVDYHEKCSTSEQHELEQEKSVDQCINSVGNVIDSNAVAQMDNSEYQEVENEKGVTNSLKIVEYSETSDSDEGDNLAQLSPNSTTSVLPHETNGKQWSEMVLVLNEAKHNAKTFESCSKEELKEDEMVTPIEAEHQGATTAECDKMMKAKDDESLHAEFTGAEISGEMLIEKLNKADVPQEHDILIGHAENVESIGEKLMDTEIEHTSVNVGIEKDTSLPLSSSDVISIQNQGVSQTFSNEINSGTLKNTKENIIKKMFYSGHDIEKEVESVEVTRVQKEVNSTAEQVKGGHDELERLPSKTDEGLIVEQDLGSSQKLTEQEVDIHHQDNTQTPTKNDLMMNYKKLMDEMLSLSASKNETNQHPMELQSSKLLDENDKFSVSRSFGFDDLEDMNEVRQNGMRNSPDKSFTIFDSLRNDRKAKCHLTGSLPDDWAPGRKNNEKLERSLSNEERRLTRSLSHNDLTQSDDNCYDFDNQSVISDREYQWKKNKNELWGTQDRRNVKLYNARNCKKLYVKSTSEGEYTLAFPQLGARARKNPVNNLLSYSKWKKMDNSEIEPQPVINKPVQEETKEIKDKEQENRCLICRKIFRTMEELRQHVINPCRPPDFRKIIMEMKELDYETIFSCARCKYIAKNEFAAKRHSDMCKAFKILEPRKYNMDTIFHCKMCGETFEYQTTACEHLNFCKMKQKNRPKTVSCENARQQFETTAVKLDHSVTLNKRSPPKKVNLSENMSVLKKVETEEKNMNLSDKVDKQDCVDVGENVGSLGKSVEQDSGPPNIIDSEKEIHQQSKETIDNVQVLHIEKKSADEKPKPKKVDSEKEMDNESIKSFSTESSYVTIEASETSSIKSGDYKARSSQPKHSARLVSKGIGKRVIKVKKFFGDQFEVPDFVETQVQKANLKRKFKTGSKSGFSISPKLRRALRKKEISQAKKKLKINTKSHENTMLKKNAKNNGKKVLTVQENIKLKPELIMKVKNFPAKNFNLEDSRALLKHMKHTRSTSTGYKTGTRCPLKKCRSCLYTDISMVHHQSTYHKSEPFKTLKNDIMECKYCKTKCNNMNDMLEHCVAHYINFVCDNIKECSLKAIVWIASLIEKKEKEAKKSSRLCDKGKGSEPKTKFDEKTNIVIGKNKKVQDEKEIVNRKGKNNNSAKDTSKVRLNHSLKQSDNKMVNSSKQQTAQKQADFQRSSSSSRRSSRNQCSEDVPKSIVQNNTKIKVEVSELDDSEISDCFPSPNSSNLRRSNRKKPRLSGFKDFEMSDKKPTKTIDEDKKDDVLSKAECQINQESDSSNKRINTRSALKDTEPSSGKKALTPNDIKSNETRVTRKRHLSMESNVSKCSEVKEIKSEVPERNVRKRHASIQSNSSKTSVKSETKDKSKKAKKSAGSDKVVHNGKNNFEKAKRKYADEDIISNSDLTICSSRRGSTHSIKPSKNGVKSLYNRHLRDKKPEKNPNGGKKNVTKKNEKSNLSDNEEDKNHKSAFLDSFKKFVETSTSCNQFKSLKQGKSNKLKAQALLHQRRRQSLRKSKDLKRIQTEAKSQLDIVKMVDLVEIKDFRKSASDIAKKESSTLDVIDLTNDLDLPDTNSAKTRELGENGKNFNKKPSFLDSFLAHVGGIPPKSPSTSDLKPNNVSSKSEAGKSANDNLRNVKCSSEKTSSEKEEKTNKKASDQTQMDQHKEESSLPSKNEEERRTSQNTRSQKRLKAEKDSTVEPERKFGVQGNKSPDSSFLNSFMSYIDLKEPTSSSTEKGKSGNNTLSVDAENKLKLCRKKSPFKWDLDEDDTELKSAVSKSSSKESSAPSEKGESRCGNTNSETLEDESVTGNHGDAAGSLGSKTVSELSVSEKCDKEVVFNDSVSDTSSQEKVTTGEKTGVSIDNKISVNDYENHFVNFVSTSSKDRNMEGKTGEESHAKEKSIKVINVSNNKKCGQDIGLKTKEFGDISRTSKLSEMKKISVESKPSTTYSEEKTVKLSQTKSVSSNLDCSPLTSRHSKSFTDTSKQSLKALTSNKHARNLIARYSLPALASKRYSSQGFACRQDTNKKLIPMSVLKSKLNKSSQLTGDLNDSRVKEGEIRTGDAVTGKEYSAEKMDKKSSTATSQHKLAQVDTHRVRHMYHGGKVWQIGQGSVSAMNLASPTKTLGQNVKKVDASDHQQDGQDKNQSDHVQGRSDLGNKQGERSSRWKARKSPPKRPSPPDSNSQQAKRSRTTE